MADTSYALRLKKDCAPASFMAAGTAVELTEDGQVFTTTERRVYEQLRLLPFLEDAPAQTDETEG
jgi:hypothetical protein